MFSADNCRQWAKTASDAFLSEDVPIKKTIAVISSKNDLNPQQIQRIIEIANQVTYARLFKQSEDKTFSFPTCQLSDVLDELKGLQQPQVGAVLNPTPNITRKVGLDKIQEIFGHPTVEDTAPAEKKKQIILVIEKLASAQQELNNRLIMAEQAGHRYIKDIKTVVKQLILDGYDSDDLFGAMAISFPDRKAEVLNLIMECKSSLESEGIKTASHEPVDEKYIADLQGRYGVKVINAQHPLYLTIRDFFSKADERLNVEGGTQWIGRKIQELQECCKKL